MYQVIDKRDNRIVFESAKYSDVECYILVGDTDNILHGRSVRYGWRKVADNEATE